MGKVLVRDDDRFDGITGSTAQYLLRPGLLERPALPWLPAARTCRGLRAAAVEASFAETLDDEPSRPLDTANNITHDAHNIATYEQATSRDGDAV